MTVFHWLHYIILMLNRLARSISYLFNRASKNIYVLLWRLLNTNWLPALEMKIWTYWSRSNFWIYFYIFLNKNWKIYWSVQRCICLGLEDRCLLWRLGYKTNKKQCFLKNIYWRTDHRGVRVINHSFFSVDSDTKHIEIIYLCNWQVQPNNYAILYDDSRLTWSLMFDSEQSVQQFAKYVSLKRDNWYREMAYLKNWEFVLMVIFCIPYFLYGKCKGYTGLGQWVEV